MGTDPLRRLVEVTAAIGCATGSAEAVAQRLGLWPHGNQEIKAQYRQKVEDQARKTAGSGAAAASIDDLLKIY